VKCAKKRKKAVGRKKKRLDTASIVRDGRLTFDSRMVASLDRKRLGQAMFWKARNTPEAFSIRRLGGSRWRLRRTR
jgi:hypothetical protein